VSARSGADGFAPSVPRQPLLADRSNQKAPRMLMAYATGYAWILRTMWHAALPLPRLIRHPPALIRRLEKAARAHQKKAASKRASPHARTTPRERKHACR